MLPVIVATMALTAAPVWAGGGTTAAKPPVAPRARASLGVRLAGTWNQARLAFKGVPAALRAQVKKEVAGTAHAFQRAEQLGDVELAAMSETARAELARALIDPNIVERLVHPHARADHFLRVVTARGSGAGSVDAVLGRLEYGTNVARHLLGPAKQRFLSMMRANRARPGDWAGFRGYLDEATGSAAHAGSRVEPLINGEVAFPAMQEAIGRARSSVHVSVYAFQSDDAGWDFARDLAGAADRGVRVRLMYDPVGSKQSAGAPTDPKIYAFLRQHGVDVIERPPGALDDHLSHRKITVVDGELGFTGGMNIGDEYRTIWHDVHARVTGPAVADLQRLFVSQWKSLKGHLQPGEERALFPVLAGLGGAGDVRVIGHDGLADQNMKLAYLRAIDTAQHTIHIANPYFSDRDVSAHLQAAARRGVEVVVVLPKTNDMKLEQDAERDMYHALLQAGVRVYEYYGRPMAHDKLATFDGQISTIGSSNLDARSLWNNDEANVWSTDPAVARQLDRELFARDLEQSDRITTARRGLLGTIRQEIGQRLARKL